MKGARVILILTTDLPDIRRWQLRPRLAFNQDRFIGPRGCPTAFHLTGRSRSTFPLYHDTLLVY